MPRLIALLMATLMALAACTPVGTAELPPMGPDGRPLPRVYRISESQLPTIQHRALDAVNTMRASAGAGPLALDAALNAAAATHSRDMSHQSRPWHFGSDGSSPIDRVTRAGYRGSFRGELVSETFESELETITAWVAASDTRNVLLDRQAHDMGFAFHQDANGKLWWTMVLGARGAGTDLLAGGF